MSTQDTDILELSKQNGYFFEALTCLDALTERGRLGTPCVVRSSDGKDCDLIPLDFITEDEEHNLLEHLIEDDIDITEYDWKEYSKEEVEKTLWGYLMDTIIQYFE